MPKDIAQDEIEQFKREYAEAKRQVKPTHVYIIFG